LAGNTVARTPHFALHQLVLSGDSLVEPLSETAKVEPQRKPTELFPVQSLWLGAMTPKRWAKRAVTRNAIKRQVYAVTAQFEAQLQSLPTAAYVLRLRAGFDRKQFVSASSDALKAAVRTELTQLLSRGVGKGKSLSPNGQGSAAA
jgi:ribonuclease P protein component